MTRGSSPWMMLLVVIASLLLVVQCHSSALTSNSARHQQRGGGVVQKQMTDDSDVEAGPNVTTLASDDLISTVTPTEMTTEYRMPEYVVRQHQEARLACDLVFNSTSDVFNPTWLHNADKVDAFRVTSSSLGRMGALGHRYTRDSVTGQLNIPNVRVDDEGVWQCEERDVSSGRLLSVSLPIRLIVLEPPRVLYLVVDGRRLDPGNVFLPVKEGAELSVWCVVEGGHPAPSLAWLLNSADLNTTTDITVHQHSRSEAKLGTVLRAHHNATVTCLVHHVTLANPLNASLLLDVQYTPSFGISRVPGFGFPLTEGIPVSLKCDVDSNPPSSPVWVKDDGAPPVEQSGDGFLNFSEIHREHSGWYKCTSHHLLGDFSSIGYFLNVRYETIGEATQMPGPGAVKVLGRQVEVALGGQVQLQCPAAAAGCWSRVGSGGRLEAVGPGPGLSLDRVLYQEAGDYRCVTRRHPQLEQLRAELTVNLIVKGQPAVYPSNKTLTATTGQQLDLSMEFCANPAATRAIWFTEKLLLKPGDVTERLVAHNVTSGSSPHCRQAVLTLRSVKPEDEGEYSFLVRSPRGLAEGSIILNVTQASSFSVLASRSHHSSPPVLLLMLLTVVWQELPPAS